MADIEITQAEGVTWKDVTQADIDVSSLAYRMWLAEGGISAATIAAVLARLEAERAIVSWLRGLNEDDNSHNYWKHIALRIERGEHKL